MATKAWCNRVLGQWDTLGAGAEVSAPEAGLASPERVWVPADEQRLIAAVLDALRHPGSKFVPPEGCCAHAEAVAGVLRSWALPADVAVAALFMPWAEPLTAAWDWIAPQLPNWLSQRVSQWRLGHHLTLAAGPDKDFVSICSLKLRHFLRQAYLNLPVVLLAIADHSVRVSENLAACSGTLGSRRLWEETEWVFVPLLEMLGMWELRRPWLELAARCLHPEEYAQCQKNLASTEGLRQAAALAVYERLVGTGVGAGETIQQVNKRDPLPGQLVYARRGGRHLEETALQIAFDIDAGSTPECYQALELVHRLGAPVQGRLFDFIAQPRANQYRALHAAVVGRPDDPRCRNMLLEFRIHTDEMRVLNRSGIVAACFTHPELYSSVPGWRTLPAQDRAQTYALLNRRGIGEPAQAGDEYVYVFTPAGEVKNLPAGHTAIDFAYHLHTRLGHECREVRINGQLASLGAVLANGDLVAVRLDPLARGPDPAWLRIARGDHTRKAIKRALATRAHELPRGRQLLDRQLEALETAFGFVVPPQQLERHLSRFADRQGLATLDELYLLLADQSRRKERQRAEAELATGGRGWRELITVDWLVAWLLEQELSNTVLNGSGQPLLATAGTARLRFCPVCKPTPPAPILLQHRRIERRSGETIAEMVLHRQLSAQRDDKAVLGIPLTHRLPCVLSIPAQEQDCSVRWREVLPTRRAVDLVIVARDRPGLLGELLQPVYDHPRLGLAHVEASVDLEGTAGIVFTVECDVSSQVEAVSSQARALPYVYSCDVYPVAVPTQQSYLRARHGGDLVNRYPSGEPIQDWQLLFGRERDIERIYRWLDGPAPPRLITVHGQPRVGKTSLARMLGQALQALPVRVACVDMLDTSTILSPSQIYQVIAGTTHRALTPAEQAHVELPAAQEFQCNPSAALLGYLRAAQSALHPQRLLLVLDEFNKVVAEAPDQEVFSHLRAVTSGDLSGITLLLVTHSAQFEDLPARHPARPLYRQGPALRLLPLDEAAARRFVTDTMRGCLEYDPRVVSELVHGTAGHPYLLGCLCHDMVEGLPSGTTYVLPEDLEVALQRFLASGTHYFGFLIAEVEDQGAAGHRFVAAVAAEQCRSGDWVPVSLAARRARLHPPKAERIVRQLERSGVLRVRERPAASPGTSDSAVRIAVPYFCRWVYDTWCG